MLAAALDAAPDSDDLAALGGLVARAGPAGRDRLRPRPARATRDRRAFDPTVARPAIVDRVLGGVVDAVGVVDADPTAPVELTPDLDLPAWRFLRDDAPEWLLPGAGTLPDDTVVALTTNPAFVDAFLLGLNAQIVAELRFRNYPADPGWTPVRTFWDRANAATGAVDDDIVDIDTWPPTSAFGDAEPPDTVGVERRPGRAVQHPAVPRVPGHARLPGAGGARRATASSTGRPIPSFDARQFPTFQGRIATRPRRSSASTSTRRSAAERWVVLEETVNGRRFFNAAAPVPARRPTAPTSPPRRSARRGAS